MISLFKICDVYKTAAVADSLFDEFRAFENLADVILFYSKSEKKSFSFSNTPYVLCRVA